MTRTLSTLAFLVGAIIMGQTATAEDRKWEGKFDTKVALKAWDKQGKQFLNAVADIKAFRAEMDGKSRFLIEALGPVTAHPTPLSEITDADGVVWIVDKVDKGTATHTCYVTKKPKP